MCEAQINKINPQCHCNSSHCCFNLLVVLEKTNQGITRHQNKIKIKTRMGLSRAHTSAKAQHFFTH